MKEVLLICVFISLTPLSTADWANRARFGNVTAYFVDLTQELVFRLERNDWADLKMLDWTQTIDLTIYDKHVKGNITYKDGFLVSIEKAEVALISDMFLTTGDNTAAMIEGTLYLRDVTVGYNVEVELESEDRVRHYTSTYTHALASFLVQIVKTLSTGEVQTRVSNNALSGVPNTLYGLIMLPNDYVADFIERGYMNYMNGNSISRWATQFRDMINEMIEGKLPLPAYCFNCPDIN